MTADQGTTTRSAGLRFPAFITLALTTTSCSRCADRRLVYAAVINGLERHLDPLPLNHLGLAAAATEGRWLAVVRSWGPPIAHRLSPGHWWTTPIDGSRPLLLAEHHHDWPPLPHDTDLAGSLLARFLNTGPEPDPNQPPPF